jgi:hypothetical protein
VLDYFNCIYPYFETGQEEPHTRPARSSDWGPTKDVDYTQRANNRNAALQRVSDTAENIQNNPHILEDVTIFTRHHV